MACDLTKGKARACKENTGGTVKLYLFNYIEDPFTVANGVATAMNVGVTAAWIYDLVGNVSFFNEEVVSDSATQTVTNTQTITAVFHKMDAATAAEFNLLAKNYPHAVMKDSNGEFHALGITDGIDFNISATTGSAKTDSNQFTLTGTAIEKELSPKLDAATQTAFLAVSAYA